MPSVSIWLTGVTLQSTTIQVYSNPQTNINHGNYVTSVSKNCLTINKPCTITVPDGTIKVRLLDFATYCYWDIPICGTNVCGDCKLGFSNFINPNVGKLSVTNLTGTCDASIDNYWVDWYGPNDSNLFRFSSGKGTLFPGYTNTFPLVGASSPPLPPGTYVGKIRSVELNGINFSSPSTAGSVDSNTLINCSLTQTITSLSCSNTTSPDGIYNHVFTYQGNNPSGGQPAPLETFFTLNNGQTNFAYSFDADVQPDVLTLTLVKSDGTQYILENIRQGTNGVPSTNFCPISFPKIYNSEGELKRVLTLSPLLNITSNDYIKINVQPNTAPLTNWTFKCTCPPVLTYEKNCYNQYQNQSYKIKLDSLFVNTTVGCQYDVKFKIQGCNILNTTGFDNSNYRNYVNSWTTNQSSFTNGLSDLIGFSLNKPYRYYVTSYSWGTNCIQSFQPYTVQKFNTPGTERIVYTFTNTSDATTLYNEVNSIKTTLMLTFDSDNTNINYYKYIGHIVPTSTALLNPCVQENYAITSPTLIHCSTTITLSPDGLILTITTPTITYNPSLLVTPPGYCLYSTIDYYTTQANSFATNTSYNLNSTYGIRNNTTFLSAVSTISDTTPTVPVDIGTTEGYIIAGTSTYSTSTYPATPPNVLVPSLNAKTANFNDFFIEDVDTANCWVRYRQNFFKFKVRVESITPIFRFTIWAKQVTNYGSTIDTNPWISIYDSSTPGTYNSTYITP